MPIAKVILSGLAAILLAELVPLLSIYKAANGSRATGLAAVAGGLAEGFFMPLFWVTFVALFALFFTASRSGNKTLRVALFWIPTVTTSSIAITIVALITYVIVRFRNS